MLMLSPTNSPFFSSQIRTPSFSINWPSLVSTARSPIILWRLWSHKPSHKHDSNKYQSKEFVICDHKSDETRSVTQENKAYLVWLMFRILSNQHHPHRANQKLHSPTNAVFHNRGVCGQAVPSFPSPSPVIHFFFCSCSSFLDEPQEETLAMQANWVWSSLIEFDNWMFNWLYMYLLGPVQMPNFPWAKPNTLNKVLKKFGFWISLERLFQFGMALPFFSPGPAGNCAFGATLEWLWFRRRTFHVPNLMHKLLL